MIIGALIKLIKKAVDGFSTFCAFLLIKLKLWISIVFALVFIIVCALAGIPLKGVTIGYFVGGVIASFAAAVIINVLAYYKKSEAASGGSPVNMERVKMRGDAPEATYLHRQNADVEPPKSDEDKKYNFSSYIDSQTDSYAKAQQVRGSGLGQNKYDDFADLKKKYFEGQSDFQQSAMQDKPLRINSTQRGNNNQDAKSDSRKPEPMRESAYYRRVEETPMVFAMRKDPNVLIYEYSDRLEFYRKEKNGLYLEKTEYKS